MPITLISLLLVFSSVACSDSQSDKVKETFAPICERSTASLKSGDTKNFAMAFDNAIKSCSAACDGDHEPSCKALEEHVSIACKTESICKIMCESKSTSLKKLACPLAATAASGDTK